MQFYQRLRDIREDHDLTQRHIADLLGMKYQQYARYENGQQQMSMENYKVLAKYYKVSLDYLAGLVDVPCGIGGGLYQVSNNITLGKVTHSTINFKN